MKTARLVIGIITIVLCLLILFQSCAAGLSNALSETEEVSGSAGLLLAICWLIGGIISIATRKGGKGPLVAAGFYIFSAIIGFANAGSYGDLNIWSFLGLVFGIVYIAGAFIEKRRN